MKFIFYWGKFLRNFVEEYFLEVQLEEICVYIFVLVWIVHLKSKLFDL